MFSTTRIRGYGLVAMTFASHVKGREFDPHYPYCFIAQRQAGHGRQIKVIGNTLRGLFCAGDRHQPEFICAVPEMARCMVSRRGTCVRSPWAKNSATGTRTRVARVRAEYPNQLDYGGGVLQEMHFSHHLARAC